MGPISSLVWGAITSKVLNDGVDITKEKVKEAHNSRKDKTVESLIYRFTIDVLNNMTYSHYEKEKKMGTIYDTAEKLLNSVKAAESVVERKIIAILKPLKFVGNTNEDILQNLEEAFYEEIMKNTNLDLVVVIGLKNFFDNKKDTLTLLHNTLETNERLLKIEQMLQSIVENKIDSNKEENHEIISETKKYLDRWNSNMFLNNPNKRDKNPCIAIKLNEVYLNSQLPHYTWKDSTDIEIDLKDLLNEYIIEDNEKMLLILGQPGIGKSTLITWITAKYTNDNILVYGFTSSLKNLIWQKQDNNDDILDKIIEELNLSYEGLENKVLILDGFDEINIDHFARANILNRVYSSWKRNILLKNTLLIITCRENYIQNNNTIRCPYITLQVWDEGQINSFCDVYQEKAKVEISQDMRDNILKNKEILGIPILLYMTLALNISIEKEGSMVDVYDKIFALNGGIYDKCIENVKYDYSEHRISVIKEQIHELSRRIAIWMFENEPEETFISIEEYYNLYGNLNKEYEEKLENMGYKGNSFTEEDILIGSYFKLIKHCEGHNTEQLYFVHRSIYQYFVAETIYNSIEKSSKTFTNDSQIILAKDIVQYLKIGKIDNSIGDFLKQKILKLYRGSNKEKQKIFYEWLESSICKMLDSGMFYYTNANINEYENILEKEAICFENLIKILQIFLFMSSKKYYLQNANNKMLRRYIFLLSLKPISDDSDDPNNIVNLMYLIGQYYGIRFNLDKMYLKGIDLKNVNLSNTHMAQCYLKNANLIRANLEKANLEKANLLGADLTEAHLENAHLEGSYLRNAHLEGAHLKKAHLKKAYLKKAHLEGAHLEEAHLEVTNLRGAHLTGAHLEGAHLEGAHLEKAHLEEAYLRNAHLEGAYLEGAYLEKAHLEGAHLEGIHSENVNLFIAYLNRTHLERAHLENAYLLGAHLKDSHLEGSHLEGSHLEGSHLIGAYLEGAHLKRTHLESTDLRKAIFDPIILTDAILEDTKISKERYNEITDLGIDINKIIWCD